jgi:lycopene cyclase domain-containing protein
MEKLAYLAMLAFTVAGSWWLEWAFKLRVLRRIRFTLRAIAPISIFFIAWDALAIHLRHWDFDSNQILGIFLPFNIPFEEFLFFLVIPLAIILTYEGVRKLRPKWSEEQS